MQPAITAGCVTHCLHCQGLFQCGMSRWKQIRHTYWLRDIYTCEGHHHHNTNSAGHFTHNLPGDFHGTLSELLPVLNVRKFETFIGLFQLQNKFLAEYSLWVKDCCSSVCPTLAPEAGPVNKLQMDWKELTPHMWYICTCCVTNSQLFLIHIY